MSNKRSTEDWLESFMDFTENSEPPRLYRYWTGVSCIAAALQRKCFLNWGHLTFYPNMYIVLVGPSGVRKGTAMAPGYKLLSDLGILMSAQSTTLPALIRRLNEANANRLDPKTGKVSFHSSLTVFSDELAVFIGYQQKELMTALCDWFDCKDRWTYDTKNMGRDEILGIWVNLIGATTPHLIQSTLPQDAVGGGLTSRIIFVYEEKKGESVPLPLLTDKERDLYDDLRNDLEKIHLLSGRFHVTEEFIGAWTEWYARQELHIPEQLKDERFGGYLQRRPTHLMKLCMIFSASEGDSMLIDTTHLERGRRLLEATERKMPLTFSGVGRSPYSDLIPRICTFIASKDTMSLSDLTRRFYFDADQRTLEYVIQQLETMKLIEKRISDSGVTLRYIGSQRTKDTGVI